MTIALTELKVNVKMAKLELRLGLIGTQFETRSVRPRSSIEDSFPVLNGFHSLVIYAHAACICFVEWSGQYSVVVRVIKHAYKQVWMHYIV